ncbi:hypothetical protein AO843_23705 [Lysinibacillus sp. ZYM-1]|nr:hypothetical protein AO843_23705 [Lysinibacillus sp. ZYM-1]
MSDLFHDWSSYKSVIQKKIPIYLGKRGNIWFPKPGKNGFIPGKNGVPTGKNGFIPGKNGLPPGKNGFIPGKNGLPPGKAGLIPGGNRRPSLKRIGFTIFLTPFN